MRESLPSIVDPALRFFDWEDRPLAIKDLSLYLVLAEGTLKVAPPSWSVALILHNGSPISRAKAIELASS